MSFGFTQTGLNPGMTTLTEPLGPYLYNGEKNSPALRRGLSTSLAMKLLTGGLAHDCGLLHSQSPLLDSRTLTHQHLLFQGEKWF